MRSMPGAGAAGLLLLCCLAGCAAPVPRDGALPVIAERFVTAATPADEIDSVAVWRGDGAGPLLLATAKRGDRVVVYDAASGATLGSFGRSGSGPGEMRRPNGLFVAGDLVFVVERDNRRVQLFRAPAFEPVGSFGEDVLRFPYGLHVRRDGDAYEVLVTDSFRNPDGSMPPASRLDERIKRFRVRVHADGVETVQVTRFGATSGEGMLWTVESIFADPDNDRILIAEEELPAGSGLQAYQLSGRYAGPKLAAPVFAYQAEGIALRDCGGGEGWWIVSDQHEQRQRFHVFERRRLQHVGSFAGATARATDGLWFEPALLPAFEAGVLYAQHDDRAVVAFDWADIACALGLPADCPEPAAATTR